MRLFASYPLEALLRPPYELVSTTLFLAVAVLLLVYPGWFFLSQGVAASIAAVCFLIGSFRLAQGVYILVYQRHLTSNARWTLPVNEMPIKRGYLFLGKGFQWTTKQAQRLKETQSPSAQKYLKPQSQNSIDPIELPISGRPEIHGIELKESDVWLQRSDRVGHTLVLGTTRVGKSRLAELLITQDIKNNETVIVFDPKGDLALLYRMIAEAKRNKREQDLLIFHLGYPQRSCRYNAIGRFSRITEVATRIANQLPDSGNSAAFKEFAWRFVNIIAGALVALNQTPNYRKIRQYINDIEPLFVQYARTYLHRHAEAGWHADLQNRTRSLKAQRSSTVSTGRNPEATALMQMLSKMDIDDAVLEGLMSAFRYDRTYFDKIVSSVGPLMEKLTTGTTSELISPDEGDTEDPRPILDWLDAISTNKIIYVGLDALSDQTVATAVGNSMFADLVSVAGYIYKHGVPGANPTAKISLHADEFNELIGDEFVPLLNKAGGAGFQVTAYTQTWSDLLARVKQPAKAGQVTGNFNTLLMLRVRELATAELLTSQVPRISLLGKSTASGASDRSGSDAELDFETSHSDSVSKSESPLVGVNELFSLPRGHAFALLDGNRIWKIRIPMLDGEDPLLPKSVEEAFDRIWVNHLSQRSQNLTKNAESTTPIDSEEHEVAESMT